MAPCSPVVSDQPAFWHLDAARGPSTPSLDHLISAGLQRQGHNKRERLCGLEVDHKFELGRQNHRQIARFLALEYPTDIDAGLAISIRATRSVAEQATNFGILVIRVARWNSMARAKLNEFVTIGEEQRISAHEKRADPVSCDGGEGIVDMLFVACIQNQSLHSERLCSGLGVSALQQARGTVVIHEDGDGARLRCKITQQL